MKQFIKLLLIICPLAVDAKVKSETIEPLSQRGELFANESVEGFSDVVALRKKRRVGAGLSTGGQLGMLGAQFELGFAAKDAAVVGFGGGPRYSSFLFSWKHLFGGQRLSPYSHLGLAHWNSGRSKGPITETNPTWLGSHFLSQAERKSGLFAKTFFTPSFGLQYSMIDGPYTGFNFFVEVVGLVDVAAISPQVTGSVGTSFFF